MLGRLRSAAQMPSQPSARHRLAYFLIFPFAGTCLIAAAMMPFPDDPCLSPPAPCDPQIVFYHTEGVLYVTEAPPIPGSTDPPSFIAIWRDYAEAEPYVFGRRIFTHTDVGHSLLRLETLLGVDRPEFTSSSAILNDSVNWALAAPPDSTSWLLATRGQIASMLGFDVSDISDPNDLLADDDKDGDLDTDDECGDAIGGGGVPVNFEFAPTGQMTLDALASELGLGVDCCDTENCCAGNGDCAADEHCVDGVCVSDECQGNEDCPDGQHCENGECVHDPCSDPGECVPGQECVDGECKDDCDGEGDCDAGDTCDDGYCEDCPGECCDSGDCDDGNDCTMDYCRNGKCKHPPKNCNDENPCTNDYCDFGTCYHTDKCYDGNPCTEDDCDMQTGQCSYTCNDCDQCPDGYCAGCSCEEPGCSVELVVEPTLACSGDEVEVSLTASCYPDCGNGAWEIILDPPEAVDWWFPEPNSGSVDCDGTEYVFVTFAHITCDTGSIVTFTAMLDSFGDQHCEDEVEIEVIRCPDVDMDANRDGSVSDSDDDEEGENAWQYGVDAKGAIVLVNCDADGATPPARDFEDAALNGTNDEADLSPMEIRAVPAAGHDGWRRRLKVITNTTHPVLRIFLQKPPGIWTPIINPSETQIVLETIIVNGQQVALDEALHLGTEAVLYPGDKGHAAFDGLVSVELDLLDDQGVIVCTDKLQLRVAPFIIMPNTAPPHKVLVSDQDTDFHSFIGTQAGATNRFTIPEAECNDIWPQDAWEFGFSSRPLPGSTWNLWTGFETYRDDPEYPLQAWGRSHVLGGVNGAQADRTGLIFRLEDTLNDLSYGGNLELIPSYTDYPLGRIVVGSMPPVQVAFLNKQQVQGPVVQLNTSWLDVGHIDEYMSLVPDTSGFAQVWASTAWASLVLFMAAAHEPLFYDDMNDQVYTGQAEGGSSNTLVDTNPPIPFNQVIGWYVRIYDSNLVGGKHQIAKVGQNSSTMVLSVDGEDVWYFENAHHVYQAITGNPLDRRTIGAWNSATGIPNSSSKYILVPATKEFLGEWPNYTPFPALVTVHELRTDADLWSKMNGPAGTQIAAAKSVVQNALGGSSSPSFNIPVLYLAQASGPTAFGNAFAYVPGDANMQVWGNQLWLARPFGPRAQVNGVREDMFLANIRAAIEVPGVRNVFFVDNWATYHVKMGEVHCGTNVMRALPDVSFGRWWESEP